MKSKKNDRLLKLIWDFKGPDSKRTAEHHALHLEEYVRDTKLSPGITGFDTVTPEHHIAYLVVSETEMPEVRDELKPHRGQVYQDKK